MYTASASVSLVLILDTSETLAPTKKKIARCYSQIPHQKPFPTHPTIHPTRPTTYPDTSIRSPARLFMPPTTSGTPPETLYNLAGDVKDLSGQVERPLRTRPEPIATASTTSPDH